MFVANYTILNYTFSMYKSEFETLPFKTPLVFADGTTFWKNIQKNYVQHKRGFFILGPSGSGKTHFVKSQNDPHWIDGDKLWESSKAHPTGEWWLESNEVITMIDQRSDLMTAQAMHLGYWVIGASNNWLKPDAIIIPHWSTHKKYIRHREANNYDGGAKSDAFDQVLWHREYIMQWMKKGVPKFKSAFEAEEYLLKKYKKELAS